MPPAILSRALFPLHERLKGKRTYAWLRRLERTQYLEPDNLRELQFAELVRYLRYVYSEVPYYRRLLDEHELPPSRIQSFDDFRRIPFLTRDILRRHGDDLRPRTLPRGSKRMSTGGSTGVPVTVLVDRERTAFTDAVRMRAHRWFGVDVGSREIVLWASPIELTRQDVVRAVRDRLFNSRLLTAFDLGEAALAHHAEVFRRHRPLKLFGYASALYLFASYLEREDWAPVPGWPRVVFATAEPLYDFQRKLIGRVLGCAVATEYGARDAGLIATECPAGGLHIPVEGMVVETVDASSGTSADPAELVVTNMNAFATPILRYRIGDMGTLEDMPCSCGRTLPRLGTIDGRTTDFLVTPSGRLMHALAVIYILREVPEIEQFQVVQEDVNRVTIDVVTTALAREREAHIVARVQALFGPPTTVEIRRVDGIARTASGKHRYVISKVAEHCLQNLLGASSYSSSSKSTAPDSS